MEMGVYVAGRFVHPVRTPFCHRDRTNSYPSLPFLTLPNPSPIQTSAGLATALYTLCTLNLCRPVFAWHFRHPQRGPSSMVSTFITENFPGLMGR